MDFLYVTTSVNDSYTTLDTEPYIPPKKKKQKKKETKTRKIKSIEVFNRIFEVS